MNLYIIDTKYAVKELIRLITEEEKRIEDLNDKIKASKVIHNFLYEDFLGKELDRDENFTEGQYLSSFNTQSKFYEEMIKPSEIEVLALENSRNNKKHSINSLSGAILQIAKQGIGIVYKELGKCPDGRVIKNGVILKDAIWHGRNQAMHYEEILSNPKTITCINNLGLATNNNINLARDIIDMLDWTTFEKYELDMISLS